MDKYGGASMDQYGWVAMMMCIRVCTCSIIPVRTDMTDVCTREYPWVYREGYGYAVCMHVCMHVCMYACMHACTYARMHTWNE